MEWYGRGGQTHYSPFSQVASLISIACGTEDFSAMLNEIGDALGKERNPGQSQIGFNPIMT